MYAKFSIHRGNNTLTRTQPLLVEKKNPFGGVPFDDVILEKCEKDVNITKMIRQSVKGKEKLKASKNTMNENWLYEL